MSAVVWLEDPAAEDPSRVGNKAAVLSRLRRMGLPVPEGFVLTAGTPFDAAARSAVTEAYARLRGTVAVRSSSTAEDLEGASFAGQYLTVLDVRSESAVVDAVERCLGSAGAAVAYARAVGAEKGAMAVLVQRFIQPRAAGVAFTRHPSDPAKLLVESVAGLGDALVSGRAAPDRYVLDRSLHAAPLTAGGSLDAPALGLVAALARRVEDALGAPQDVEWALDGAAAVLLQARPITVAEEAPLDPRIKRLTRANVGEVLPDPVTPLTWTTLGTFLEHGFRNVAAATGLLPAAAPPFLVLFRERLFLNLSLCVDVAAGLPGVSAADAEALILGGGATGATPRFAPSALPALVRAGFGMLRLNATLEAEIETSDAAIRRLPAPEHIAALDAEGLARGLEAFAELGRSIATTHIATSGASAFRLSVLRRMLEMWAPGDPGERLGRLVAGLDGVASASPTLALELLARQAAAHADWTPWLARDASAVKADLDRGVGPPALLQGIQDLVARFGHRAVSEGELRSASWRDDPTPLLVGLEALLRSRRPAGFGSSARGEWRRADEEAILSRLGPLRRGLFAAALDGARRWVRERERTKSGAVALVQHGRQLARAAAERLAAAGRLATPDDVWFLTLDELVAGLRGAATPPARVARRRRRFEREGAIPVPREVTLGETAAEAGDTPDLRGTGVSGGVGVGRARVVAEGEAARLEPGEILVTPVLDAGLGPQLAVAAGAVAEIGGILSHGSVVARELGVPCVVDVRHATRRIRTGERVLVDGNTGRVERLAEEPAAATGHAAVGAVDPVEPDEETLQILEDHPLARESVYFNIQDPRSGVSIVSSLGIRRGQRGEALLALALGDGRILFGIDLATAKVEGDGFRVGGASTAWRPVRLRFDGRLSAHEAAGFPPAPIPLVLSPRTVAVSLDLVLQPTTPAVDFCRGLSPEALAALEPLGRHHIEQSGRWSGAVVVDGKRLALDGTGSRDHSWGRRDWAGADHWRLFTVRLGDDLAVHALVVGARGRRVEGGFVWRDGRAHAITRVEYAGQREGERLKGFVLEVSASGMEPLLLEGRVERTITVPVGLDRRPWRHVAGWPYALLLHENYTRYEAEGRAGLGMAEFTERPR